MSKYQRPTAPTIDATTDQPLDQAPDWLLRISEFEIPASSAEPPTELEHVDLADLFPSPILTTAFNLDNNETAQFSSIGDWCDPYVDVFNLFGSSV
jgi:hypothetical protein